MYATRELHILLYRATNLNHVLLDSAGSENWDLHKKTSSAFLSEVMGGVHSASACFMK